MLKLLSLVGVAMVLAGFSCFAVDRAKELQTNVKTEANQTEVNPKLLFENLQDEYDVLYTDAVVAGIDFSDLDERVQAARDRLERGEEVEAVRDFETIIQEARERLQQ